MDKLRIIVILALCGWILWPTPVMAQSSGECWSRITKTDTYDAGSGTTYPQITVQILNAGMEGASTLRIASDQFASQHLVCPLGFTADSSNAHSVTCTLPSRHLALAELNKINLAYSGDGGSYGSFVTDTKYPTNTGAVGSNNWTDANKMYVADSQNGHITVPYPNGSTGQYFGGFGSFNIPTGSQITGIAVDVWGFTSNSSAGRQLAIRLTRDTLSTAQTNSTNNDLIWLNPQEYVGVAHTYSTGTNNTNFVAYNWTAEDFNNGNFGLEIYANDNTTTTFNVDYIRARVSYRTYNPACFTASIGSTVCGVSVGSMCPDPSTGGVVVQNKCDPTDLFCKFQQWAFGLVTYYFGFDESFSQEQFAALYAYLGYKFPFGYLTPLSTAGFGDSVGSPSATMNDIDISFTPKQVHNGVTSDLSPIALHVDGSQLEPVRPFLNTLRTFFSVVLYMSVGVFIIVNAGRFFS